MSEQPPDSSVTESLDTNVERTHAVSKASTEVESVNFDSTPASTRTTQTNENVINLGDDEFKKPAAEPQLEVKTEENKEENVETKKEEGDNEQTKVVNVEEKKEETVEEKKEEEKVEKKTEVEEKKDEEKLEKKEVEQVEGKKEEAVEEKKEEKVEEKKEEKVEEKKEEKVEEKKEEKVEEKKEEKVEEKKDEKVEEKKDEKVEEQKEEKVEEKKEEKVDEKKDEEKGEDKKAEKTGKKKKEKGKHKEDEEKTEEKIEEKAEDKSDEKEHEDQSEKMKEGYTEEYKEREYEEIIGEDLLEDLSQGSYEGMDELEPVRTIEETDEGVINFGDDRPSVMKTDEAEPELQLDMKTEEKKEEEQKPEKPKKSRSVDFTEGIEDTPRDDQEIPLEEISKSLGEIPEDMIEEPRHILTISSSTSTYTEGEEEEEEEQSEVISILAQLGLQLKEKEPIDRAEYEEEYRRLAEEQKLLKRENGLLNKKISEYYLRRKITAVFEDVSVNYEELLDEYEQKILNFKEVLYRTKREKEAVDNELADMTELRNEQFEEMKKEFQYMQKREYDVGVKLIFCKTGKKMTSSELVKLLQRQEQKSESISRTRIPYIKLRNVVQEIEDKIRALETVAGVFHLIDYEQIRMENHTKNDKVEERDGEILKLTTRLSTDLSKLAHLREKVKKIQEDIEEINARRYVENEVTMKKRKILNALKQQRDTNRALHEDITLQTGLLTCPKLLDNMELSVKTAEILKNTLDELIEKYEKSRRKTANLKSNIMMLENLQRKSMPNENMPKEFGRLAEYRTKPTIAYEVAPIIIPPITVQTYKVNRNSNG